MTDRSRSTPARYRLLTLAAVAVAVCAGAAQSGATVDEIVAKNLAAKGGVEKLRAVNSVRMSGRVRGARGVVSITAWSRRPNLMRQESVSEGRTAVTAFDGRTLWAINPVMGAEPREIGGAPAERARDEANDFDSVLLDYKAKGYTVELVSTPGAAPHLRVTKKNGKLQDMYLNPSTFLEERITTQVEQGGKTAIVGTEFSNYKPVDGMMVPFTIRQSLNGQLQSEVMYEQVQFNLPLNDDLFRMPKK